MDFSIASILLLDGVTNGAIYALLGLATVLVFTVTRVIFIPQGEFVAYGALTLAMLQTGKTPGTVWLLLILAAVACLMELVERWRHHGNVSRALLAAMKTLVFPVAVSLTAMWAAPQMLPLWAQAILSVFIVTAFGPLVYRVAYQSLESATPLVLLIVSVGVHFAMTGLGLLFFGAEGFRNPTFWDERFTGMPYRHGWFQAGAVTDASRGREARNGLAHIDHQSGAISGIAAVYQRHEFMAERKAATELWSEHVTAILLASRDSKPPPCRAGLSSTACAARPRS